MNVFLLNALISGHDLYRMLRPEVDVAGYIGLHRDAATDAVAGYFDAEPALSQDPTPFVPVRSYGLTDPRDRDTLLGLPIDVLVVAGWQRLVPDWLIRHCRVAVLGVHGSPLGITRGRGRSPQNWALLMGMPSFEVALFRIDAGIDSGPVLATRQFQYVPEDDIRTSYVKVACATAEMVREALADPARLAGGVVQDDAAAEYLPQRRPEDGQLDWTRSSQDITNAVRAQTRPYPGAFFEASAGRYTVWRAVPYPDCRLGSGVPPGTVLAALAGGEILVRCSEGAVIVTDYDGPDPSGLVGEHLRSAPFADQLEQIVARHRARYPDLPVSGHLLGQPAPLPEDCEVSGPPSVSTAL